jgi:hypothetical protein
MQFETGIWQESTAVLKRNLMPSLVYVGIILAIAIASEFIRSSSQSFGYAFAAALLAIPAHLTVLKNTSGFANSNKIMNLFVVYSFGLGIVSALPGLILFVLLMSQQIQIAVATIFAIILGLLAATYVFAKWGTMLPAIVMGSDRSIAAAGKRGQTSLAYAFTRLLLSFGLLTILQFVVSASAIFLSGGNGNIFTASKSIDLTSLAAILVCGVIGAYQIVMTATVLSRSYLLSEFAP